MKKETEPLSRRDFAKAAALMTTATVLVPSELLSQTQTDAPDKANQPASQQPKLSPASQSEADAAYESLIRKYGHRFTDEQKADIKRLVNQQQSALDKLRGASITNSDEPATIFRILTDDQSEAK